MAENKKQEIDMAAVDAAVAEEVGKEMEEITIKFGKGLMEEPFMSKKGTELVRIKIPNKDPNDHSPWAEFVLASKQVHENKFGKGLWAKLPADGHTTVSKSFPAGKDAEGKTIWDKEMRNVSNKELKEMVEFYKTRDRGDSPAGGVSSPGKEEVSDEEPDRKPSVIAKLDRNREKIKEIAEKSKPKNKEKEIAR